MSLLFSSVGLAERAQTFTVFLACKQEEEAPVAMSPVGIVHFDQHDRLIRSCVLGGANAPVVFFGCEHACGYVDSGSERAK